MATSINFPTYGFINDILALNEENWRKFFKPFIYDSVQSGLETSAGTGMTVNISGGECRCGAVMGVLDNTITLDITNGHSTYDRIDSVVVQYSYGSPSVLSLAIKRGIASGSPVAPTLSKVYNTLWEMEIAQILVPAGATSSSALTITDTRVIYDSVKSIIDDNAGDGDTDVVWSAGKSTEEITDLKNSTESLTRSTNLPDNTDLNNITTPGTYYVTTLAHSSTILHKPTGANRVFRMVVFNVTSTVQGQVFWHGNMSVVNVFYRAGNATSGWSDWVELSNNLNFIDDSATGGSADTSVVWSAHKIASVLAPMYKYLGALGSDDDLNNITSGIYTFGGSTGIPANVPKQANGLLLCYNHGAFVFQICIVRENHNVVYWRSSNSLRDWSQWNNTDDLGTDIDINTLREYFVETSQGIENANKMLIVGADGNIVPGSQIPENITPNAYVTYKPSVTVYVGENIINSETEFELNNGWTGNISDGFTHISGNTKKLIIKVPTEANGKYIVDATLSSNLSSQRVFISIGNSVEADSYNGSNNVQIGFISDGGYLYIRPRDQSNTNTISNITVRKIQSAGTPVTLTMKNVTHDEEQSNISGFWNVALGDNTTFVSNTNGSRNVAIGKASMSRFKGGTRNVCIGTYSMPYVTSGERNIAIGADTIYSEAYNDTENVANDNIAIGMGTLANGELVERNIAMGYHAMHNNSPVSQNNVAIGYEANMKSGDGNVAIGFRANRNCEGDDNIAIGNEAGRNNTGTGNIIIGKNADTDNTQEIENSIAIGNNVVVGENNTAMFGNNSQTLFLCGKKINFNENGSVTWESLE